MGKVLLQRSAAIGRFFRSAERATAGLCCDHTGRTYSNARLSAEIELRQQHPCSAAPHDIAILRSRRLGVTTHSSMTPEVHTTARRLDASPITKTMSRATLLRDDMSYRWDDNECLRSEFLQFALEGVKVYGWSPSALRFASEKMELSNATASLYSLMEVGYHFIDKCNREVIDDADRIMGDIPETASEERVLQLLRRRIKLLYPYSKLWSDVVARSILSPVEISRKMGSFISQCLKISRVFDADNIGHGVSNGLNRQDTIQRKAAITVALMGLYTSAQMFAMTDPSEDFIETQDFISRRGRALFDIDSVFIGAHTALTSILSAAPSMGLTGPMFVTPFESASDTASTA